MKTEKAIVNFSRLNNNSGEYETIHEWEVEVIRLSRFSRIKNRILKFLRLRK
jgi:hypothetical protein